MACASLGLVPVSFSLWTVWLFLLIAALFRKSNASLFLVYAVVFFLSVFRFGMATDSLSGGRVDVLAAQAQNRSVWVEGSVVGLPSYYPGRWKGVAHIPFRVEGVMVSNGWQRVQEHVQVRVLHVESSPPVEIGSRLRCSGALRKRNFPGSERFEFVLAGDRGLEVVGYRSFGSFWMWGECWRKAASERLARGIQEYPDQLAVYRALLLGYRKQIPPEINRSFSRTGTLHIFAISGLHVGMLSLLLVVVLKAVGVSRERWGYVLIPVLFAYVLFTGMKPSAMRAFTMAALYFAAPFVCRKTDLPTSVALAAVILLFVDPLQISSIGFIYSFVVVSFIILFFAAGKPYFPRHAQGRLGGLLIYARSLVISSVAAGTASAPLTAYFFGMTSPISLVGNLAVVPLTFCIVLCGWLSQLFSFGAVAFNYAALGFIDALLAIVRFCEGLPLAFSKVVPPPFSVVLLWYAGWIGLLLHLRKTRERTLFLAIIFSSVLLMWMF